MKRPDSADRDPAASPSAESAADRDLVQQAIAGEELALDSLSRRLSCVPRIVNSINQRYGRPLTTTDVADLSQDVVVLLWEKMSQFEGRATLETWAYRHALFASLNRFRKVARRRRVQSGSWSAGIEGVAAPTPPDLAEAEQVERSLEELGPPQSEVIRLKHFEDRTFAEIGAILGIPANTAKTHYYRGLQWLRRHFGVSEGTAEGHRGESSAMNSNGYQGGQELGDAHDESHEAALAEFLAGEGPPDDRRLKQLLEQCEECKVSYFELRETVRRLEAAAQLSKDLVSEQEATPTIEREFLADLAKDGARSVRRVEEVDGTEPVDFTGNGLDDSSSSIRTFGARWGVVGGLAAAALIALSLVIWQSQRSELPDKHPDIHLGVGLELQSPQGSIPSWSRFEWKGALEGEELFELTVRFKDDSGSVIEIVEKLTKENGCTLPPTTIPTEAVSADWSVEVQNVEGRSVRHSAVWSVRLER